MSYALSSDRDSYLFFQAPLPNGRSATVTVTGPRDKSRLGNMIENALADLGAAPIATIIDLEGADYTLERRERSGRPQPARRNWLVRFWEILNA